MELRPVNGPAHRMPPWFHRMDEHGETPMSRALKSAYPALVKLILAEEEAYVQERLRSARQEDAEYQPQREGYWGMQGAIERLLDAGLDPSETDAHGNTPLMHAVCLGQAEIAKTLIDRGTDVNVKNADGLTPLHWAALNGNSEMARLLLEHGAKASPEKSENCPLSPAGFALLMGHHDMFDLITVSGGEF